MKSFGIYLAALFAGAALATGCYEDKGNYDYTTTGDDIVVYRLDTMKSVRLSWSYDEEIVIEPGYRIVHDRVSEGSLRYEWNIDGETVSTDRILSIDPAVGRTAFGQLYGPRCRPSDPLQYDFHPDGHLLVRRGVVHSLRRRRQIAAELRQSRRCLDARANWSATFTAR